VNHYVSNKHNQNQLPVYKEKV